MRAPRQTWARWKGLAPRSRYHVSETRGGKPHTLKREKREREAGERCKDDGPLANAAPGLLSTPLQVQRVEREGMDARGRGEG